MAEMSINSVIMSIMAVAIGMIMVGNLLIPIAVQVIDDVGSMQGSGATYGKTWQTLMSVVVLISIVGLVIVAINNYTKR